LINKFPLIFRYLFEDKFFIFLILLAVVECPSEDYLEPFVSNPAFTKYQTGEASNTDDTPYCIIHFTPQSIMDSQCYIDWMNKFDPNTRHIVVNEKNECMGSVAIHRHQHKLHMLHPNIFPLLNEDSFKKRTQVKHSSLYNNHFSVMTSKNLNCLYQQKFI